MKRLFILILMLVITCFSINVSYSAPYWSKTYGGSKWDSASSIQQTSDGGYVAVGYSYTLSSTLIMKLDSGGNITWGKTYEQNRFTSIQQTADKGYIVAGFVSSSGTSAFDMLVLKLDTNGNVSWVKTYGGSSEDGAAFIQQTEDGGYILTGNTKSFGDSYGDIWVLKLNSNGDILWQKTYGGIGVDTAYSIQRVSDGGYVVAGNTESFPSGNCFWVIKLDSSGTVTWQKTYGQGSMSNKSFAFIQTMDEGYMIGGHVLYYGYINDLWLLKLDRNGNISWQKKYGSGSTTYAKSIQQTLDGGYIVAGNIRPVGADFDDLLVLKLDSSGNITWQKTYGESGWEDALSIFQTTAGNYIVAGNSNSFGEDVSDFDILILKLSNNGEIPNCDIVNSINMVVAETAFVEETSNASVQITSVSPADRSVTVQDASVEISCNKIDLS